MLLSACKQGRFSLELPSQCLLERAGVTSQIIIMTILLFRCGSWRYGNSLCRGDLAKMLTTISIIIHY